MSEKKIAASTPYRRTGCSVISTTRSGFMQDSSIPTPSRTREVLRQRAAGLAHEPDRRVRHRLAAGGAQERAVCGSGACGSSWAEASQVRRRVRTSGRGRRTYCGQHGRPSGDAPGNGCGRGPPEFRAAVDSMHAARLRPEVFCEEMPAPQRIAPYAAALSADVTVDGTDVGTGRIILLHDPAGQRRLGRHLPLRGLRPRRDRARPDHRPDARRRRLVLADRGARRPRCGVRRRLRHRHPGRHRELRRHGRRGRHRADRDPRLVDARPRRRTPPAGAPLDLAAHVEAWGELLCTAVGLPPVPEGVTAMPSRRGQRGAGR